MNCPANTYTVDGLTCLTLPSGIKSYSMISRSSETIAIVLPFITLIIILFCSLFILREKNINNVNEFEINSIERSLSVDVKEPINPILISRID